MALSVAAVLMACPVFAQDGRAPDKEKPKAAATKAPEKAAVDKPPDVEASRFCANAAPSIAEARIAWETDSSTSSTRRSSNGWPISKKRKRR
jgi:hypothetical protein